MVDSTDSRANWRTSQPKPKKTKKFLIFPEMEGSFSYISANETLHLPAQARKIKKIEPEKISYTSANRNSYIFLKRKLS